MGYDVRPDGQQFLIFMRQRGHAGRTDYCGRELVGGVAAGAMIGLGDGMCEAHHATDTKLRREVTIKILPSLSWRALGA
jgi:hypothetical protein